MYSIVPKQVICNLCSTLTDLYAICMVCVVYTTVRVGIIGTRFTRPLLARASCIAYFIRDKVQYEIYVYSVTLGKLLPNGCQLVCFPVYMKLTAEHYQIVFDNQSVS
jgi:hypothetical protein